MGEEVPSNVKWALDILEFDETARSNIIRKHPALLLFGTMSLPAVATYNAMKNRPLRSGLQFYLLALVIGSVTGAITDGFMRYRSSKIDAMVREYIILNPGKFPEPERKKWSEIYEPWKPLR